MSTTEKTVKKSAVSAAELSMMDDDKAKIKVYELSYLISSAIPQEKITLEKDKIHALLTKIGATTIAGEDPEFRDLAYEIKRKVGAKNERFTQAYFGWVKFEASPSTMDSLKKDIDALDSVIRYLLVTTIKENTYLGKKASPVIRMEEKDLIKDESIDLGGPIADVASVAPVAATETAPNVVA